jgi:hypothetical protein
MPTSTRSDVKSTANKTASGFPRVSVTFNAIRQGSPENRATNRVPDQCRTTRLPLRTAVLSIAMLSMIGWAAIVVSVVVLL